MLTRETAKISGPVTYVRIAQEMASNAATMEEARQDGAALGRVIASCQCKGAKQAMQTEHLAWRPKRH